MAQTDYQAHLDAARFLVERHERIGEGLSTRAGVLLGLTGVQFAVLTGLDVAVPWGLVAVVDLLLLAAAGGFTWCLAARTMLMPSVDDLRKSVSAGTDGTVVALEQLIGLHDKGASLVEQYRSDSMRRAPGLRWGTVLFLAAQVILVVGVVWSQWEGSAS